MKSTKAILKRFKMSRTTLFYLAKIHKFKVHQTIENGHTQNYYDEKQISATLRKPKTKRPS